MKIIIPRYVSDDASFYLRGWNETDKIFSFCRDVAEGKSELCEGKYNASHRAIITMMNSKRNIASGTDQKAKTVPALFIHCVLLSFPIVSLQFCWRAEELWKTEWKLYRHLQFNAQQQRSLVGKVRDVSRIGNNAQGIKLIKRTEIFETSDWYLFWYLRGFSNFFSREPNIW